MITLALGISLWLCDANGGAAILFLFSMIFDFGVLLTWAEK